MEEEIKKFISDNNNKFPLSFNSLVFKKNKKALSYGKAVQSKRYSDNVYSIYKFYKAITRF